MEKTDRAVILDTCILDYGVKKDTSAEIAELLPSLAKHGFKPAISGFQLFEAYRGLNDDRVPNMKKLLTAITPLDVDTNTFRIAAALYSCYKCHEATRVSTGNGYKPRHDDDGDITIAATALRYDALIITANGNDFPRPFFNEVGPPYVLKRASNKAQIRVYLLRPDITVFNETVKLCYPKGYNKDNEQATAK